MAGLRSALRGASRVSHFPPRAGRRSSSGSSPAFWRDRAVVARSRLAGPSARRRQQDCHRRRARLCHIGALAMPLSIRVFSTVSGSYVIGFRSAAFRRVVGVLLRVSARCETVLRHRDQATRVVAGLRDSPYGEQLGRDPGSGATHYPSRTRVPKNSSGPLAGCFTSIAASPDASRSRPTPADACPGAMTKASPPKGAKAPSQRFARSAKRSTASALLLVLWGTTIRELQEDIIPPFCGSRMRIQLTPLRPAHGGITSGMRRRTTFIHPYHQNPAISEGLLEWTSNVPTPTTAAPGGLGTLSRTLCSIRFDRKGYATVVPIAECYGSSVFVSRRPATNIPKPFAFTFAAPLLRAWTRDCACAQGEPVACGAHGLVQLVARFPYREEPLDLSRSAGGPRDARASAHRQLRRVARQAAR